jgi:putative transposase
MLTHGLARLRRFARRCAAYFNAARPHQGLGQRVPVLTTAPTRAWHDPGMIMAIPVLGGLHHMYHRAV